jgi:cytochrome d ubiquinol oxidase subunit I
MSPADTLVLARAQFGLNIGFHILFPVISMALAWFLLFFRVRAWRSTDGRWMDAYRRWTKIFALTFAMGVVSGIVMSFQFGTNWPGFMSKVGNIAGPLLAYEVLTAFFLEATFLGVMLFGQNRVPDSIHVAATALVAFGTSMSAFWILSLNSWMQTPTGHTIADGQLIAADWFAVIFNPSFPFRLTHMLLASGLTAAFFLAGLSAWRMLHDPTDTTARLTLRSGIWVAAVIAPLQVFVGDLHGLNTLANQPAKIAAIEGVWHTEQRVPLLLFALPNELTRHNDFAIAIPGVASLILTHHLDGSVRGLDEFEPFRPPVMPVFFAFRVMVGVGLAMIAVAWITLWKLRRSQFLPRPWLWVVAAFTFAGWIATVAGWLTTEIGRQPWLVTGILRTDQALGAAITAPVQWSLPAYALTYAGLLIAYMVVITQLASRGTSNLTGARR